MKHTPHETEPVVIECDLPDPPEKVWRALTEANLLAAWLMPNDLRPAVGAQFRLRPQSEEGDSAPIECEVLEAEPARVLRWQQSERDEQSGTSVHSIVTFELSGMPNGGTHLRLVHDGFARSTEDTAKPVATRACAQVIELQPRRLRAQSARRQKLPVLCSLRRAA
jgi:uncharacterized protein YndB with AHSA1/START domain